jgi:uncharacterized protein (TIGR02117 family)
MNANSFRILAVLIPLLLFSACSSEIPLPVNHIAEQQPIRKNQLFVVDHGWHTGFVVPAKAMDEDFPFLKQRFPDDKPYYELGWGDKGFYQSHEITTGLTFRAMFASDGSVMHIVSLPESPVTYFPNSKTIEILLSDNEYRDLRLFFKNSFAYDQQGNVIKLTQGLYGDSQFYEGSGTYYMFNTCNKWTAKGLKSAGMDIFPGTKLTAGSIENYLESAHH